MSVKVRDYYVEEVDFLTSCGVPTEEITTRLGKSATALAKGLRLEDRPDLARPFEVLRNRQRAEGRVCACGNPILTHVSQRCVECGQRARVATRLANERGAA